MNDLNQYMNGDKALVIRKPVYEALPYVYLLLGVLAIVLVQSPWTYLFGAMLYAAGATVWIMRSAYRRRNARQAVNRRKYFRFPPLLYEYLPFIYIAVAVALLVSLESPLRLLPAGLFLLAGILVWLIRAIYRSKLIYDTLS